MQSFNLSERSDFIYFRENLSSSSQSADFAFFLFSFLLPLTKTAFPEAFHAHFKTLTNSCVEKLRSDEKIPLWLLLRTVCESLNFWMSVGRSDGVIPAEIQSILS